MSRGNVTWIVHTVAWMCIVFSTVYNVLQQSLRLQPPTPPVSFELHGEETLTNARLQQNTERMFRLHASYGIFEMLHCFIYIIVKCSSENRLTQAVLFAHCYLHIRHVGVCIGVAGILSGGGLFSWESWRPFFCSSLSEDGVKLLNQPLSLPDLQKMS